MPIFSLSRKTFIDRLLGAKDLDDMAGLWFAWHEQAQLLRESRLVGYHAVELRLCCFPRSRGALLKEELQSRLRERHWDYPVDLADPDVLRVSSPFRSFAAPCSLGDWLALVQAPSFCGLIVFLRLSLHDWPGRPEGPARAGNTLVLYGQLEKEGIHLMALWPADLERGPEPLFEKAAWPYEADFLKAFEQYRHRGQAPAGPTYLFASRTSQKFSTFLLSLVLFLPGVTGRLTWFVTRVGFLSAALVLLAYLYFTLPHFPGKSATLAVFAVLSATALGYVVVHETKRVRTLYRRMTAALKERSSQTLTFESVDLAERGVKKDARVAKYTAELEALGCQRLIDVRRVPAATGTWYNRLFVLPEENTYVFLNLMLATGNIQKFPAHVFFHIATYFDYLQIVSVNEGAGFRKPIVPNVQGLVFLGVHDPALLLTAHRKRVAHQREQGHVLLPLMNVSALLERLAQDEAEASAAKRRHGYYSWSAAVRQNFKLVRRDQLGRIEDT